MMSDNERSGEHRTDGGQGSSRSEVVLLRVLREAPPLLLDVLPDEDKASLAASCWSALETVLRDTRAVLKVHPDDPVIGGLARRLTKGPCAGSVNLYGVQVPATDAGALLKAAKDVGFDLPLSVVDRCGELEIDDAYSQRATRAWADLVRALTAEPGGAHVTRLTMPFPSGGSTATAEAQAMAKVLQTPALVDSLRALKVAVRPGMLLHQVPHEAVRVLRAAMRGLSALQHLELVGTPFSMACLNGQESCLTTLELGPADSAFWLGLTGWEWFVDPLERATNLRSLKLPVGPNYVTTSQPRGLPMGLEVLRMDCTAPLRWWETTNLRSLELHHIAEPDGIDPVVWKRLAELISRSKELRRLVIGDISTWPHSAEHVIEVFAALERGAVEELVFTCPDGLGELLTAAAASMVRNTASLRELELTGRFEHFNFNRSAVVRALHDTTTLRKLRLHAAVDMECPGAALGGLLSRNTSLVELDVPAMHAISWTPEGTCEFLRGLGENRTLQVLRSGGPYGPNDGDIRRLMDALYGGDRHEGRQLHTLTLASPSALHETNESSIRDDEVECIAAVLEDRRSSKLRRLILRGIKVGDRAVEAIARALRGNCWLESLELSVAQCEVTSGWDSLAAALAENTTLRHLDIRQLRCGKKLPINPLLEQLLHAQRYAIAQRQTTGHSC